MLNRIIDLTLEYRWLVLLGIVALLGVGGYALYTIQVEAFPDLTNNRVVVVTDAPSLPPTAVEQLVTYPIERAMLGLPNKEEVRPLSKQGLSMVTIVFTTSSVCTLPGNGSQSDQNKYRPVCRAGFNPLLGYLLRRLASSISTPFRGR